VVATLDKGHLFVNAVAQEEAALVSNHSFKFKLPKGCSTSAESISATIENGILKVVLPKEIDIKRSTEIKIK
jgi:HSP20 family molecular chaperone IbpA